MDTEIAWDECLTDLPLDNDNLPPLNALSSSSSEDLPQLQLLDLFSIDSSTEPSIPQKPYTDEVCPHLNLTSLEAEKLSTCTSTPSATSQDELTSPISDNAHSTTSSPQDSPKRHSTKFDKDREDQMKELCERLKAAGTETSALRKRVAALTAENRGLRAALDHANARLVAVAQAAAAHPPPSTQPLVVGLAQVSTEVANRLGAAMTVSDTTESEPNRKKRKRVAGAATTMACVMFMWGALVGTPGLMKSGSGNYRSEGNLPAVWSSQETAVAPTIPRLPQSARAAGWQPNCMRVLKQLPTGSEDDEEEVEVKEEKKIVKEEEVLVHEGGEHGAASAMFVDVEDKAVSKVVARSDVRESQLPEYSYVLCRDAASALDNVKSCATRMRRGESCGQPHTISLIVPASAAGVEDNETSTEPTLAEVQCSILSVARIPNVGSSSKYGRVIATVPERTGVGK